MDKLDDGCQLYVLAALVGENAGTQQNQGWSQAFAATIHYIVTKLVNESNIRVQLRLDEFIHPRHILADQGAQIVDNVAFGYVLLLVGLVHGFTGNSKLCTFCLFAHRKPIIKRI